MNIFPLRFIYFLLVWAFCWPGMISTAFAQSEKELHKSEIMEYRQKYYHQYLTDPRAPYEAADTVFLSFFPIDYNYKVTASLTKEENPQPFDMALYSGITRKFIKYGTLTFELEGGLHDLSLYQDISRGNNPLARAALFLPFKDLTNGEETYGGGRYFDLKVSDIDADGTMVLDFNKAYNPWCAYSEGYNCPIPPKENHLALGINAGEKDFQREKP